MPMSAKLNVKNPSPWPRRGHVATPWQPISLRTGIAPEELVLRGPSGAPLRSQVDPVDPGDPTRAMLVFLLDEEVPPGADDYSLVSASLEIERRAGGPMSAPEPERPVGDPLRGFKLVNGKLEIWFNLQPDTGGDPSRNWFAGCATSVLLENRESLDAFRALFSWMDHDPEKRCMQVDRVRLPRPPWEDRSHQDEFLFNRPYFPLWHSSGSVRTCATVTSAPFTYAYSDPMTDQEQNLECKLHRVISLYHDADYVIEELSVRGKPRKPAEEGQRSKIVELRFAARYFANMDIGLLPEVTRFSHVPDWLSLGCSSDPFPSYGFATSVHTTKIRNPPLDYPDSDPCQRCRAFSWELGAARVATCLHLFKRCRPAELSHQAGHAWYEHIYKPLRAELAA
jgi:hypothetical protein